MHYELEITLKNEYFDVKVNYNIISYLRQFNNTEECWYSARLSKKDINYLKTLTVTKEEENFINKLSEHTPVDILEHVRF